MVPYVVRQGDHLVALAYAAGVSPSAIWDHPQNRHLRQQRGDGSILAPHDVIYIPEPKRTFHSVSIGATTHFKTTVPVAKLEVILEDDDGPMANEPFVIVELPTPGDPQKTGPDGLVTILAPITMLTVTIHLVEQNSRIPLLIGHLDPATDATGVEHRLANLGYRPATTILNKLGAPPPDIAEPLRQFQRASKLPITGVCDNATRQALIDRHGC